MTSNTVEFESPQPSFAAAIELPIPAIAHFIWLGHTFPWTNVLALATASRNGGFQRIVLHLEQTDAIAAHLIELAKIPKLEVRRLDPEAIFDRASTSGQMSDGLFELYRRVKTPAARANILRAAILHAEGGVYFDMDTITLRTLTPLRGDTAFCGLERICLPIDIKRSWAPHVLALTGARMVVREACRIVPQGWRPFRVVEGLYPLAANNAVLGASPGHRFTHALLRRMLDVPRERQMVRYALGTHLLQETLRDRAAAEVVAHSPEVFYPLAPEISEHWFKPLPEVDLDSLIDRSARVVHWYASVRTEGHIESLSRKRISSERQHLPFAALACRAMAW